MRNLEILGKRKGDKQVICLETKIMSKWKFQIRPSEKDSVGIGYQMDPVGQEFENEVNDALPDKFCFHQIAKIVVVLAASEKDGYSEILNIGTMHVKDFPLKKYIEASDIEKRLMLENTTRSVFEWIQNNFEDANFIAKATQNLKWVQ